MGFMEEAKREYDQDLPKYQQRQAEIAQERAEGKAKRQGAVQSAGSGISKVLNMGGGGMTGMMFAANMFDGMADNVMFREVDGAAVMPETSPGNSRSEIQLEPQSGVSSASPGGPNPGFVPFGRRPVPPEPTASDRVEQAMADIEAREQEREMQNENAFGLGR